MKQTNLTAAKAAAAQRLRERAKGAKLRAAEKRAENAAKRKAKKAAAIAAKRLRIAARDKAQAESRRLHPPTKGQGARQPILSLQPLGEEPVHPLTHLMSNKLRKDDTKSDVARALAVAPQSIYKWERACRADPHFPLPVLRAKQLAAYFRVSPTVFRPDFPWGAR